MSRVSSEGGGGDGVLTEKITPLSRVSSEGGDGGGGGSVSTEKIRPSVSRFERGRGW